MKIARRLLLLLLLGLLTSLAGAWVLALLQVPQYPRTEFGAFERWGRPWGIAAAHGLGARDLWWDTTDPSASGQTPPAQAVSEMRAQLEDFARERPEVRQDDTPPRWGTLAGDHPPAASIGSDTAFGFPALCLWYRVSSTLLEPPGGAPTITNEQLDGGWLLGGEASCRGRDFRALPLRPIWSGLALNTVFFAALWFALLAGIPALRRALRRRRGLCARCGYDLRATPANTPCPECGTAKP